jgi:hypothetical protein
MDVSGQLHGLAALLQGKSPRYPLDRRQTGPDVRSGRCGRERKLLPTASYYTDWANTYVNVTGQTWYRNRGCAKHRCEDNIKIYFKEIGTGGGIATGYGLDDRGVGVQVLVGLRIFSSPRRLDWLRYTQPPIQWVPRALSPGVKRSGREADHSPPTSAEVKKTWLYISTPPYVFMV